MIIDKLFDIKTHEKDRRQGQDDSTDHSHHPGKRNLGIIVGLHHGIGFRNLQLLDIQVKIQEEIGHKDRTSPNDTDDN